MSSLTASFSCSPPTALLLLLLVLVLGKCMLKALSLGFKRAMEGDSARDEGLNPEVGEASRRLEGLLLARRVRARSQLLSLRSAFLSRSALSFSWMALREATLFKPYTSLADCSGCGAFDGEGESALRCLSKSGVPRKARARGTAPREGVAADWPLGAAAAGF